MTRGLVAIKLSPGVLEWLDGLAVHHRVPRAVIMRSAFRVASRNPVEMATTIAIYKATR